MIFAELSTLPVLSDQVAIHEAMCFVETAFKNNPTRPDHAHVPSAVFTTPELAAVGLSDVVLVNFMNLVMR